MRTYLHMKSGKIYEVKYLSIQPFMQHSHTDFASYLLDNESSGLLFEADELVDGMMKGHIVFNEENIESIEQVNE